MAEIILAFVAGWVLGVLYIKVKIAMEVRKILEDSGLDINKILEEEIQSSSLEKIDRIIDTVLNTEQHGGYLYLYKDSTYLCQASTLEELAMHAHSYKNISNATVAYNKSLVKFVNGKVEYLQGDMIK